MEQKRFDSLTVALVSRATRRSIVHRLGGAGLLGLLGLIGVGPDPDVAAKAHQSHHRGHDRKGRRDHRHGHAEQHPRRGKQGRVHAQAQRCGRKGGPCCAAPDRPCGDPFLCINGSCEEPIPGGPCPDGQLECSGRCVDLRADAANCGDCGVACESGQGCCDGVCDTSCVCQPKCEGRECGPDGCGGTCGTCAGTACSTSTCDEDAGRCVQAPMAGCCQTDVDCDDENSCTTDTCVNGTCQHSTRDNFSVCGATATGNCQRGVCETCRATQLPCEDNRQCCDFQRQAWGGWCAPSIDFPGFSVCCRNQGMSCGTGSDCCTGVCTAGGCSCRDAARTCTNARQCCSGVCGPNTHGQLVCL